MQRIELGFQKYKGKSRGEIVNKYCPYEVKPNLDDMDVNTFKFSDEGVDSGCRGITCEQCWDKECEDVEL